MICYQDKTFCNEPTCDYQRCDRRVTDDLLKKAAKFGLPVAQGSFRKTCLVYMPKKGKK